MKLLYRFYRIPQISVSPIRFSGHIKGTILAFREWNITQDRLTIKTNNPELILRVPAFDFEEWFESFL